METQVYTYQSAAAATAEYYTTTGANQVIYFTEGAMSISVNKLLIENLGTSAMYVVPLPSLRAICIPAGGSRVIDHTCDGIKVLGDAGQKLRYGNYEAVAGGALPAGTNSIGAVSINGTATMTHTAVTIGATTGVALAANANRKYAIIVNDSDTAIYIKLHAAAVASEGIRINANGGSYEMSAQQGNLDTRAINAISTGAGKVLLVAEGV